MKTINLLSLCVAIVAMFMMSCSGGSNNKSTTTADNKLGKLKVEIPAELKDKPEVVEYIHNMTEVADAYANMIDNIMAEAGDLIGVPEEELTMMQRMKLVKIMAETAMTSTTTMAKWAEYMENRYEIEQQLTDDELHALSTVWVHFEERMKQIDEKYHGALSKNSN